MYAFWHHKQQPGDLIPAVYNRRAYGAMIEANGFYYMRACCCKPYVGGFISEHPLGFDGGDISLYIYATNSPILYIDPNGEFLQSIIAGSVAGGLVGGVDFVSDSNKTGSVKEAAKSALIASVTAGLSVGFPTSGVGSILSGAA